MKPSLAVVAFGALVACGGASAPPVAAVVADAPPANAPPAANAPPPANAPSANAPPPPASAQPQVTDAQAAELARQADQMQLAILGSASTRPAGSAGSVPPVDLSGAQARGGVVAPSTPGTTKVDGPKGDVQIGGTSATLPIANGDRVVAGLRPRFRQCYQQGLNNDPTMSGKIVLVVKVGPNGEVSTANVASNSGMSPAVAACVVRVMKQPQFEPPGGAGTTLNVPLTFVQTK